MRTTMKDSSTDGGTVVNALRAAAVSRLAGGGAIAMLMRVATSRRPPPPSRTRGSSSGESRSAIRLTTTNTTAASATMPCSTGVSWFDTAWYITEPMPLRPNTSSVMIAPPISSPAISAAIVTAGSIEGLTRCRANSRAWVSPRERATSTYSWPVS